MVGLGWKLTLLLAALLGGVAVTVAGAKVKGWRRVLLLYGASVFVSATLVTGAIDMLSEAEAEAERQRVRHAQAGAGRIDSETAMVDDILAVRAGATYYARGELRNVNAVPIDVRVDPDTKQLLASVEYHDPKGELVCKIRDNEWIHLSERYDRNYSDQALEIYDPQIERPVLQVILSGNTAVVFGQFLTYDGQVVWLTPNRLLLNPESPPKLRPLFRYPSELHPGEISADLLQELIGQTKIRVQEGIQRIEEFGKLPPGSNMIVIEARLDTLVPARERRGG